MLFTRLDGRARVVDMNRGKQEEQMDGSGKGRSQQANAIASAVALSTYGGISLLMRALPHDLPLKVSPPIIVTQGLVSAYNVCRDTVHPQLPSNSPIGSDATRNCK